MKWRVGIHVGGIYSKAYPKYLFKNFSSRLHSYWVTKSDDGSTYIPGFYSGISFSKKQKRSYFDLQFDVSNHGLKYIIHESYGGPVTPSTSYSIKEVYVNYWGLNYQLMFERRLYKSFYLSNAFLFHQNLSSNWRIDESVVVTTYTNNTVTKTTETKDFKRSFQWISGVSYRLGFMWEFVANGSRFSVRAFRNFGFPARPWWGLGFTYYPLLK